MDKGKMQLLMVGMCVFASYYLVRVFGKIQKMEFMSDLFLLALLIKIMERNIKFHLYADKVTLPAMGLGVAVNLLTSVSLGWNSSIILERVGLSVMGLILGGLCFYSLQWLGHIVFRKESVGGGDVKLAAAIGAFIGPSIVWFVPIWVCVWIALPFLYNMAYAFSPSKRTGLIEKSQPVSVVPSAPIHFIALTSALFIKRGLFDFITLLFGIGIVIVFVISLVKR